MARNASEILLDVLEQWGVEVIFGLPGDGINGIMEALRQRQDRIRFIQVRHEESAALMACGYAKWTGRLGVCLATTGPGGVHLLNGLYDAKLDNVPVLAITGAPYHDLIDTHTQQDIDHCKLFMDVAVYTARIMSAAHVENTVCIACRKALSRRGVAHVAVPTDVQEQALDAVERSMRNVEGHVSHRFTMAEPLPDAATIDEAVRLLDAGRRVAILAGQGAMRAREELLRTADLLGAPIVKALLGKGVVPDAHPLTTGGAGLLGTRPSQVALEECDTLLIVGSTFPYIEYYPKPGKARCIQIDIDASRISLRYPADVAIVADAGHALRALNARLQRKQDRSFIEQAQEGMAAWRKLLRDGADKPGLPMKPQRVVRDLGDRLPPNAIVATDSGHNTGLTARYVELGEDNLFAVSGTLATMACAVPYAIAAAIAFPGRPVIAIVGDGGLSMLLGELATIVRYRLPIKLVVLKNNTLGQIKWEQMMFLGNPEFECDLQPIDFAGVAKAMGIAGYRIEDPEECGSVLDAALAGSAPALVEAVVDPNEPLLPPKRRDTYVQHLHEALAKGTPGKAEIERALAEEPARTLLS